MATTTYSRNILEAALGKEAALFSKDDIIHYIVDHGITMVNFMYPAADGRLKTLNFVINDKAYLDTILSCGERVDGSSLFPFIEPGNSDLYVLPRFSTAFIDPVAPVPTLTMLCSYFDKNGKPLAQSPETTLDRACAAFTAATGLRFQAMGELEYYVIAPEQPGFPAADQRGYHESAPFAKFNDFRVRCMQAIASMGGRIKYGHSEVGNFTLDGFTYEQNEIEFLPVDARLAADQLMLAKWVIRALAAREGLNVTFAPKITVGKAGSGLHFHTRLMKGHRNMMVNDDRSLSDDARRLIAGFMILAPSLTAFGNTIPTSYFRLVPNQEAPTCVCWGDRNRSVLVRVPLGWSTTVDLCAAANPGHGTCTCDPSTKQTVEIRSADGSANIYLFLAGLAVAARLGFSRSDALDVARSTYVDVDIHSAAATARRESLASLPASCAESAALLRRDRHYYEADGIFHPSIIDAAIKSLESFDESLSARDMAPEQMIQLVNRYFYCG